jgi:Skp family chaperone for outer membrane proteins
VRPTPVPPADVAKAARALPAEVAEAIDSALESARQRQQDRVEHLRAELEAAQRALQDLTG